MELFWILLGVFVLYARTWIGKDRHYYIIDDNVRRWGYLYDIPQSSPPADFYSTKPHPWRHFFLSFTHCLNVWVIYELFGWQVAALFAFSPISVNGTAWITGGYYAVTMFLTLTSYYFITNFPGVFGIIMGSLFFTASLGSTITCIGVPFVLANTAGFALFGPLTMYLIGKRFRTGFNIRNMGKKDIITFRKIAVMTKVMAYYIKLCLFPYRLAFFRSFGYNYIRNDKAKKEMDSFNKLFWQSLGIIGLFIAIGWQFSPLGTIWFLITLAPFTQFKVLGQFVAERYLYLPQIGIYLIIANVLSNYPHAFIALITLYIYRSHLYIPSFKSITNLYKNGIQNDPQCISNYANLGERYLHLKQTQRALRLFQDGLKIDNMDFLCHTNLAAYWISVKSYHMALFHTSMACQDKNNPIANRILPNQYNNLVTTINNINTEKLRQQKEKEKEKKKISINPYLIPVNTGDNNVQHIQSRYIVRPEEKMAGKSELSILSMPEQPAVPVCS